MGEQSHVSPFIAGERPLPVHRVPQELVGREAELEAALDHTVAEHESGRQRAEPLVVRGLQEPVPVALEQGEVERDEPPVDGDARQRELAARVKARATDA